MYMVYAVCAAVGGTIFLCQFVMSLLGLAEAGHDVSDMGGGDGFGADHAGGDAVATDHGGDATAGDHSADAHTQDHDHPAHVHGSSWFFGVLTFRTIVAAVTFFGLTGLACSSGSMPSPAALGVAVVAGVAAMLAVHSLMRGLQRLGAEGTVHIEQAVGATGEVYLKIPGHKSGLGKVTVDVQNRTMEYQAMTGGEELPTGAKVVVVGVVNHDTVDVMLQAESV
jgi:hypothetical protein